MPTYQYACTECGHRFEAVQAFTDDSLTTCPVCSGQLRKVYGSVGVVFKGSGFYRTDSRNGKTASTGASTAAGSEGKPEKPAVKAESSSGTSSDAKPAASTASSGSSTSSATKAAS